ncbi:MAG TPA: hypothetical protein VF407_22725 [Polyangiaceae bacterium]
MKRTRFLVVMGLACVLGCSSSSGDDDDVSDGKDPVVDSFTAPDSITESKSTPDGPGWIMPFTLTWHDDYEKANTVTFSFRGSFTQTLNLTDKEAAAGSIDRTIFLYGSPGNFTPGSYAYSVTIYTPSNHGVSQQGTVVLN